MKFYVYDETPEKFENAKNHVFNALKKVGYDTDKSKYKTEVFEPVGNECTIVTVQGDFKGIKSFQGNTKEYELFFDKNRKENPVKKQRKFK